LSDRSRPPYVTLLLIAANILAAFIVLVRPEWVDEYGFRSSAPSVVTAITSLFVHANALHLMGNMVFLAAVGVAVEIATGSGRFSLVYFASGLVGVGLYWMATRRMEDPPALVGASGAIAGCAGYYSLRYTKLRVPLAPKRSASVAFITVLWLLLQLAGAIINIGQPVQASGFFAHLGGAICGLILGLLLKAPDLGGMRLGHAVLDALNDQGPEAQIAHLRAHLSQHPGDISVQLRLAHEHEELGDKAEEIALLSKLVFGAQGAEQVQSVDRLLDLNGLSSVTPVRRRQLADQLETSQAIKVLMTIVDGDKNDPQRPEAMLDLAGRLQGSEAEDIARRLAEEYPLHATTEVARQKGWLV
jgi:membrane associated rhomboid family serine protease